MTLEELHALRDTRGQELLATLAREPITDDTLLSVVERFRKSYPASLVSAAVELARLRQRAGKKFARADEMFFTRDGLEMASSEMVARYTARRFSGLPRVLDLCCGIGGDALALADAAGSVIAVDRDPLMLEMLRANASIHAVDRRIETVRADVVEFAQRGMPLLNPLDAIFVDPSRRETPAAARRPDSYSPPLSWCLRLVDFSPRVAIKVSPALDYSAVESLASAEVEIISLNGECKEGIYWLGAFRTCARRATLLTGEYTLTDDGPVSAEVGEVGDWMYEPDTAIIRAHLVQRIAGEYDLRLIDHEIAYLTGNHKVDSPLMKRFRVLERVPWSLKRLNAVLAARGIGQVTVKKRGFPLTPDELRPLLRLAGTARATLLCTRARGRAIVVVAE